MKIGIGVNNLDIIDREYCDMIDVRNLFSQWHRDIKNFTIDLDQKCALNIIKSSAISLYDISNYKKLLNFTNTKQCKQTLYSVLKAKDTNEFFNILLERDKFHPRTIDRGYTIEKLFSLVENDDYHPLLFLELNKKLYIIDGRTRLYCCLFLNKPAKVRIISDIELNKNCK